MIKKGDSVILVKNSDNRIHPDEVGKEYVVSRKFTRRWDGDQFVQLFLLRKGYDGQYTKKLSNIMLSNVIKTNTKLYELKKSMMEEQKNEV